jgi:release factor glutamine methyltransferase
MATDAPWTVRRLLDWTREYLARQGSESPRLDAEVLLGHALGWHRVQLYTRYEDEIPEAPRSSFRDLVRRRAEGAPVAYLVGRKEFFSLSLHVSPAVLIPRPDSEFVVVEFLNVMRAIDRPLCVDVGTGSGNLALACLSQHPTARFHAVDRSADAIRIARRNAEHHKLESRITLHLGDLLGPVAALGPFDAILSNPPYIPTSAIPSLEPGVRDFEPHAALDGGPDGLGVLRRLVAQGVPLLKPGGLFLIEIGSDQEQPARELLATTGLELAATIRDGADHPRVLKATKPRLAHLSVNGAR